ncbi:hypothetical protein HMPREF1985_01395 [Mitsuokella sp. oral taxon 131 str. W9106]|nr:hypothetical protein HMPREF1985_01395 [Mitsuokella sp. oral taxon 131 str. W9106]
MPTAPRGAPRKANRKERVSCVKGKKMPAFAARWTKGRWRGSSSVDA